MAHWITNERVRRIAVDIKSRATEAMVDARLKQEGIAASCGVGQPTVCRWLDPDSDNHIPAYALAVTEPEFAIPTLNEILKHQGHIATKRIPIIGELNGSLVDELTSMVSGVGKLADQVRGGQLDKRACRKVLRAIICEAQKADDELDACQDSIGGK